jgi:dTDP-4-dehydrorhamnose 3,5-epimerase
MNFDIKDIIWTPLDIISVEGGDVRHIMKSSDNGFNGFGEAYFSSINYGAIKAWKRHNKMTLNLVVPIGEVSLVCYDDRVGSESYGVFSEIVFLKNNYGRITIPPMIWFGFKGISTEKSLIINIADIEHDPDEVDRKNENEIEFSWEVI